MLWFLFLARLMFVFKMNRRSFLLTTTGLALSHLLAGCRRQDLPTLSIRMLNGSVPSQALNEFRNQLQKSSIQANLDVSPEAQLQALFSLLQTWKHQGQNPQRSSGFFDWIPFLNNSQNQTVSDLVTIGDFWLSKAIAQDLIQPLDPQTAKTWSQIAPNSKWQQLVTRNSAGQLDEKGKIWAAPYRWGSTVIVYRKDIFQEKGFASPTDWDALWRPELRQQISLLDQPREVIGLVLKKLGQSYNTENLNAVKGLKPALDSLRPQAKLYSSDAYLQPLLLGDTWLAVGWSTDVVPLLQRSQSIAAIVPASGTALWADLWVRPKRKDQQDSELAAKWIDFCWQPNIATQLSLLSRAASPVLLRENAQNLPTELSNDSVLLPDSKILAASEFLLPLEKSIIAQYQAYWKYLREGN